MVQRLTIYRFCVIFVRKKVTLWCLYAFVREPRKNPAGKTVNYERESCGRKNPSKAYCVYNFNI